MFIVLADSRTGSHLLRSLLDNHPGLTCYDEILGLRKNEKDFYTLKQHEGCLVNYPNLIPGEELAKGNDIPRIMEIIRNNPVIHLTRQLRDRAKSQLFYAKAKAKKQVFRKANLEIDQKFNPELDNHNEFDIDCLVTRFRAVRNRCLAELQDVQHNWLEITYEWLCGDRQITSLPRHKAEKICRYLQVPVTELHTNLYKIRKFGK